MCFDIDVAQRFSGLKYDITGAGERDVLKGGRGDDIFKGDAGVAFLDGGKRADILYANGTGPEVDVEAHYRRRPSTMPTPHCRLHRKATAYTNPTQHSAIILQWSGSEISEPLI